jgi:molecular chaperone Hsp33
LAAATVIKGILCTAAGGYLIEQLPGVDKETIARIQENLTKLVEKDGSDCLPTGLLLNGVTPLDIAEMILDGLDMQPLQQLVPKLVCDCTEDRLFRSLRLLPRDEVLEILEKKEQVEARCEFCGKVYRLESHDLRERLDKEAEDSTTE